MMFLNLKSKYILAGIFVVLAWSTSAQQVVTKYDAHIIVGDKDVSGILIQATANNGYRYIFVSKPGLKLFDVETSVTKFNYTIHYFSPVFKTEKRVTGIAKEMYLLGYKADKMLKKDKKVRFFKSKGRSCKSAFGLFGKRVQVCSADFHTTVRCKFYPVKFDLKILK